jgi:exonuclease III
MDPSKIICWNVRGLNSSSRQSAVRELVSSFRAEVVCIQETKMEDISRFSVISWLGADFADFVFLPSVGASGGILVAWKSYLGRVWHGSAPPQSSSTPKLWVEQLCSRV